MVAVLFYWLPVVAYCGLIFILSSHPMPETVPPWPFKDKLLHLSAYAVLGALVLRALKHSSWRHHRVLIMGVSMMFAGLYGLSDEWHQYYVPYRSAEFGDLLADIVGGVCGVIFFDWLWRTSALVRRF